MSQTKDELSSIIYFKRQKQKMLCLTFLNGSFPYELCTCCVVIYGCANRGKDKVICNSVAEPWEAVECPSLPIITRVITIKPIGGHWGTSLLVSLYPALDLSPLPNSLWWWQPKEISTVSHWIQPRLKSNEQLQDTKLIFNEDVNY